MTINIPQLKEEYENKKSPEYLRQLIIQLYQAGVTPPKITINLISKIFGYRTHLILSKPSNNSEQEICPRNFFHVSFIVISELLNRIFISFD